MRSSRRSCKHKPSLRPSTWFASVRCCNGRSWDSCPGPSVLYLLLHVCERSWRHDVYTNFPSRVIHTPDILVLSDCFMLTFAENEAFVAIMNQNEFELAFDSNPYHEFRIRSMTSS